MEILVAEMIMIFFFFSKENTLLVFWEYIPGLGGGMGDK